MRDETTLKGYTKEEVKIADELLRFLAKRNPEKKRCSFIEPTICDGCNEKIETVRFVLKQVAQFEYKCFSKDCDSSLNIATIYCAHHFYERIKEAQQALLTKIEEWARETKKVYLKEDFLESRSKPYDWHGYSHALSDLQNYLEKLKKSQQN